MLQRRYAPHHAPDQNIVKSGDQPLLAFRKTNPDRNPAAGDTAK
jgi:hypothetical protein